MDIEKCIDHLILIAGYLNDRARESENKEFKDMISEFCEALNLATKTLGALKKYQEMTRVTDSLTLGGITCLSEQSEGGEHIKPIGIIKEEIRANAIEDMKTEVTDKGDESH